MRLLLIFLLATSTGCYGKLKRAAPMIDTVDIRAYPSGRPYVNLGGVYTREPNFVADIVNTAQAIRSVELTRRIANAVDQGRVATSLASGVSDALGAGPPFAYGTSGRSGTVQLELLSYGMDVVALGAPGRFVYTVRTSVFDPSGRRVYRNRITCDSAVGAPAAISRLLWTVDNAAQVQRMSDRELSAAFEQIAGWCGEAIALRMRRHAG